MKEKFNFLLLDISLFFKLFFFWFVIIRIQPDEISFYSSNYLILIIFSLLVFFWKFKWAYSILTKREFIFSISGSQLIMYFFYFKVCCDKYSILSITYLFNISNLFNRRNIFLNLLFIFIYFTFFHFLQLNYEE